LSWLDQRCATLGLIVEVGQGVDRLVDPSELRERLRQARWPITHLQGRMMPVAGTRPSFREPTVRNISSQCGVIRSSLTHCRAKLLRVP